MKNPLCVESEFILTPLERIFTLRRVKEVVFCCRGDVEIHYDPLLWEEWITNAYDFISSQWNFVIKPRSTARRNFHFSAHRQVIGLLVEHLRKTNPEKQQKEADRSLHKREFIKMYENVEKWLKDHGFDQDIFDIFKGKWISASECYGRPSLALNILQSA